MNSSERDLPDEYHLVDRFDSFEDPQEQSDFLDAIGRTRPYIDALRARREAVRRAEKAAAEPRRVEPRRRRSRSSRHPRVVTRPPNRTDIRSAFRRRRSRNVLVVVLVIELD
ncbi:hypothetical protein OHA46_10950 [Streptomyces sp. NBC_00708]